MWEAGGGDELFVLFVIYLSWFLFGGSYHILAYWSKYKHHQLDNSNRNLLCWRMEVRWECGRERERERDGRMKTTMNTVSMNKFGASNMWAVNWFECVKWGWANPRLLRGFHECAETCTFWWRWWTRQVAPRLRAVDRLCSTHLPRCNYPQTLNIAWCIASFHWYDESFSHHSSF